MLSLFKKNPVKKLRSLYEKKLEQAMHAQRSGDIKSYSRITAEAEELYAKIKVLDATTGA